MEKDDISCTSGFEGETKEQDVIEGYPGAR